MTDSTSNPQLVKQAFGEGFDDGHALAVEQAVAAILKVRSENHQVAPNILCNICVDRIKALSAANKTSS